MLNEITNNDILNFIKKEQHFLKTSTFSPEYGTDAYSRGYHSGMCCALTLIRSYIEKKEITLETHETRLDQIEKTLMSLLRK